MPDGLVFSGTSNFVVPQFYEYLLVVHPAKEIYEQLRSEKEVFSATNKVSIAKKTLPHITIANFSCPRKHGALHLLTGCIK
jgi:hypothetical protein